MATDKVKHSELFENDITKPTRESFDKLNLKLEQTETHIKELAKVVSKELKGIKVFDVEGISKANELINVSKNGLTQLEKIEKDRIKLLAELKKANSDKIQQNEEIKLQLSQQKKTNKEIAKQKLIELGVLKDEKAIKKALLEVKKAENLATKARIKAELELANKLKQTNVAYQKQKFEQTENIKKTKTQAKFESKLLTFYQKKNSALNELRKRYKDLQLKQNLGVKLTKKEAKELNSLTGRVLKLDRALKKVDKQSGIFNRNVGNYPKLAQNAARSFVSLASSLGLVGGVAGFLSVVNKNAELSESLSDVRKTTGLTDNEVNKLADSFDRLNTRTSTLDLLGIATGGGRLGVAKDELEAFTIAVDKVFVALGDELGGSAEDISTELAKISDVFGITQEFGVAEGITKIGSSINFLGAETKAQSGFLLDFTKRLAGARELTNVSATDVLGYGATLDELGQSVEVSGTSISQIFIKMAKNSQAFAKASGQDLGEFEKLINTDINEAFIQFSEGVASASDTTIDLINNLNGLGLDGVRTSNIVGALTKNIDKLRHNQELASQGLVEGTSVLEEYNIKNNNLSANLDKIGRIINRYFTNSAFTKFLTDTTSLIIENTDSIKSFFKILTTLTVGLTAYKIVQVLSNKESKIAIFLTKSWGKAQALLTGTTKASTVAMNLFNKATKANIIGALVGLVLSAVTAWQLYREELDESAKSQEELNKNIYQTNSLLRQFASAEAIAGAIVTGADLAKFSIKELNSALQDFENQRDSLSEKTTPVLGDFKSEKEFIKARRVAFLQEEKDIEEIILALKKQIETRSEVSGSYSREIIVITDLIKIQQDLLKQQNEINATTDEAVLRRNLKIDSINEEIKRLQALGREQKLHQDRAKKLEDNSAEDAEKTLEELGRKRQAEFDRQELLRDLENEREEEQQQKRLDNLNDLEKSRKSVFEKYEEQIHREAQLRQDALDRDISTRKDHANSLRKQAEAGNAEAAKQLLHEEEQILKAEQRKKEIAEREAKIVKYTKLADVFFSALNRYMNDPNTEPKQAFPKAIAEVGKGAGADSLIRALASASFIEGTENVSQSMAGSRVFNDGIDDYMGRTNDGKLLLFDGNERIMNPEQNAKVKGLSNDKLALLGNDVLTGKLQYNYPKQEAQITPYDYFASSIQNLERKIESSNAKIEQAIKDKPVPQIDIDQLGNVTKRIITDGVTEQTKLLIRRKRL